MTGKPSISAGSASSTREFAKAIVYGAGGWVLLIAYVFYDYVVYGKFIVEHVLSPPHVYETFFHVMIAIAPAVSAFAGYLEYRNTKLLRAAREGSENWERVFNATTDIVFILDRGFNIIKANRAAVEKLGKVILGKHCYTEMHHQNMPIDTCPHRRCLDSGAVTMQEVEEPPASGQFYEVTCSPIRDAAGAVVGSYHVARDIKERKRLEKEKREIEAQLWQSQKMEALGRFASAVAHDMNNLLTVVLYNCRALAKEARGTAEFTTNVKMIEDTVHKGAKILASVLTFGRTSVQNPGPFALDFVIGNFRGFLERVMGKDIELRMNLGAAGVMIRGNEGQIEQVLMNLATNARDAMPSGGSLTIETRRVDVTAMERRLLRDATAKDCILLTVSDTGAGIEPGVQEKIFEPFFTTKDKGKGTGLGLATVYGIVTQHGGGISLASEKGKGTTFRIYLPAAPSGGTTAGV